MRGLILVAIIVVVGGVLGYVAICEALLHRKASSPYRPRYRDGGEE